jgi:hypothetical protein
MGVMVDLMTHDWRPVGATPSGTWRSRFLPPSQYGKVFDRAGNAWTTVLYDGRVTGAWVEHSQRRALRAGPQRMVFRR